MTTRCPFNGYKRVAHEPGEAGLWMCDFHDMQAARKLRQQKRRRRLTAGNHDQN